jgi:hypothetical protein
LLEVILGSIHQLGNRLTIACGSEVLLTAKRADYWNNIFLIS